jgi:hypothetical protein
LGSFTGHPAELNDLQRISKTGRQLLDPIRDFLWSHRVQISTSGWLHQDFNAFAANRSMPLLRRAKRFTFPFDSQRLPRTWRRAATARRSWSGGLHAATIRMNNPAGSTARST